MLSDLSRKTKIFIAISIFLVVTLSVGGIYFFYFSIGQIATLKNEVIKDDIAVQSQAKEDSLAGNSSVDSGEKNENFSNDIPLEVSAKSENFRMKEIVFGGYDASASGEDRSIPLQIVNVRSEVLTSKDGKSAKLLISWKTSKLAKSEIIYSKGAGSEKTLSEEGSGYAHALVVGSFDFSTRYTYSVNATDSYGNKAQSEKFVVYAGKKSESVFELIVNEFKGIFSWTRI